VGDVLGMDEVAGFHIPAEEVIHNWVEDLEERMEFGLLHKDLASYQLDEPTYIQELPHQVLAYASLPQTAFFHCLRQKRNFGIRADASL